MNSYDLLFSDNCKKGDIPCAKYLSGQWSSTARPLWPAKCASLFTWRGCPDRAAQWALKPAPSWRKRACKSVYWKAQEGGNFGLRIPAQGFCRPGWRNWRSAFLSACGYEESGGLESLLGQLIGQSAQGRAVSHEIGIFWIIPRRCGDSSAIRAPAGSSCQGCGRPTETRAARKRLSSCTASAGRYTCPVTGGGFDVPAAHRGRLTYRVAGLTGR